MTNQEILNQIHRGVIVSCQALPDEPLYGYHFMGHLAFAAKEGGAVGIRANTCEDIVDIKKEVDLPVIAEGGVWERGQLQKVFSYPVHAAVIGTAITRPRDITRRFVEAIS